jgi:hypothetical protein
MMSVFSTVRTVHFPKERREEGGDVIEEEILKVKKL